MSGEHTISHCYAFFFFLWWALLRPASQHLWSTWHSANNWSACFTSHPRDSVIAASLHLVTPAPIALPPCPTTCSLYLGAWCFFFFFSYKWGYTVFVFLHLTSLSTTSSRTIHVIANGKISFFLQLIIFQCVYVWVTKACLLSSFHVCVCVRVYVWRMPPLQPPCACVCMRMCLKHASFPASLQGSRPGGHSPCRGQDSEAEWVLSRVLQCSPLVREWWVT